MLLDKNADFTAADGNGATALHYVAQSNFSETVAVFLSFDKIKDIPDKDGRTALMWASGKGWYKCLTSCVGSWGLHIQASSQPPSSHPHPFN